MSTSHPTIDPVGPAPALDEVHTQAAEAWFARLAAQIRRDTDPMPQVVARELVNGTVVQVVDLVAYPGSEDRIVRRGFLFFAFTGDIRLRPAPESGDRADICGIDGGTVVGHGRSAAEALDAAHLTLTGRTT